jgi:hypothetical protein
VPFVSGCWKTLADLVGEALVELQSLLPHGLMTNLNAPGRPHLLHHAQTQGKAEIQPDCMADHLSREAVAGIMRRMGVLHPSRMPLSGHSPVNLTMGDARVLSWREDHSILWLDS